MTESESRPNVDLSRIGDGRYKAVNDRGGVLPIGSGEDPDFTPVELLLAAIAGCSAIDVDAITAKRADALRFDVHCEGDKVRDTDGNHLTNLRVTFDVVFPDGPNGDEARAVLPRSVAQSRDRLCTVSRTITLSSPVEFVDAPGQPIIP